MTRTPQENHVAFAVALFAAACAVACTGATEEPAHDEWALAGRYEAADGTPLPGDYSSVYFANDGRYQAVRGANSETGKYSLRTGINALTLTADSGATHEFRIARMQAGQAPAIGAQSVRPQGDALLAQGDPLLCAPSCPGLLDIALTSPGDSTKPATLRPLGGAGAPPGEPTGAASADVTAKADCKPLGTSERPVASTVTIDDTIATQAGSLCASALSVDAYYRLLYEAFFRIVRKMETDGHRYEGFGEALALQVDYWWSWKKTYGGLPPLTGLKDPWDCDDQATYLIDELRRVLPQGGKVIHVQLKCGTDENAPQHQLVRVKYREGNWLMDPWSKVPPTGGDNINGFPGPRCIAAEW